MPSASSWHRRVTLNGLCTKGPGGGRNQVLRGSSEKVRCSKQDPFSGLRQDCWAGGCSCQRASAGSSLTLVHCPMSVGKILRPMMDSRRLDLPELWPPQTAICHGRLAGVSPPSEMTGLLQSPPRHSEVAQGTPRRHGRLRRLSRGTPRRHGACRGRCFHTATASGHSSPGSKTVPGAYH